MWSRMGMGAANARFLAWRRPIHGHFAEMNHAAMRFSTGSSHPSGFQSLGVNAQLVSQLQRLGIRKPTAAQAKVIPLALKRRDVVIAAETGGGKTLAYLVPLVQHLHSLASTIPLQQAVHPLGVILTSTQELVAQIEGVIGQLDPEVAASTISLSSMNQVLRPCAVVIATPTALLRVSKPSDFDFTQTIVVDEADMVLNGGFEKHAKQLLGTLRNAPVCDPTCNTQEQQRMLRKAKQDPLVAENQRRQFIFSAMCLRVVYATIPDYGKKSVQNFFKYKFPTAEFVATQGFHRTLPQIDSALYRLEDFEAQLIQQGHSTDSALTERQQLLLDILVKEIQQFPNSPNTTPLDGQKSTLVFANSVQSADKVYAVLQQQQHRLGQEVELFHSEIPRNTRQEIVAKLSSRESSPRIVVCTDMAARGLDTMQVGHVVQYEFARDAVNYLHRLGRTARAGSSGKVSSIVTKEDDLIVSKILQAGADSLTAAFSRKRSLRKKFKKSFLPPKPQRSNRSSQTENRSSSCQPRTFDF